MIDRCLGSGDDPDFHTGLILILLGNENKKFTVPLSVSLVFPSQKEKIITLNRLLVLLLKYGL